MAQAKFMLDTFKTKIISFAPDAKKMGCVEQFANFNAIPRQILINTCEEEEGEITFVEISSSMGKNMFVKNIINFSIRGKLFGILSNLLILD